MLKKIILGIETSCDETACALYDAEKGLLAHMLYSQIERHRAFGGVVPELASRDHVKKMLPLFLEVCEKASVQPAEIGAIAYTRGPGLVGALMVGASFAKALSYALKVPAIGVNHLEAHILVAEYVAPALRYPYLTLLVSGGHSMLLAVEGLGQYQLLGETRDDAAGEAFDKCAKLLGLPYPGGVQISKLASTVSSTSFHLPRPMQHDVSLDFSFSGLKTATRLAWEQSAQTSELKAELAFAVQQAIVDSLVAKVRRALEVTGYQRLVVAGGVAANSYLRECLSKFDMAEIYFPPIEYCTDNALMVAYTGFRYWQQGKFDADYSLTLLPRWPLSSLQAV